ncbi:Serine/threonine phosphatase stp [Gammaproteobacteria bacterium]
MTQRNEMLEVAFRSDVGRVRSHNEDRVSVDTATGLVVLADGMGGHKAGEVASGIATDLLTREVRARITKLFDATIADAGGPAPQTRLLRRIIEHVNSAIHEASTSQSNLAGMGTTVVALLFWMDRVSIAHVGDSRVYRLRGETLERLTRDHSLIQELVDHGLYTQEQARTSPNRHLVTRALGLEAKVRVELSEKQVDPTDIFLLCSDGLTDMVKDEDIFLVLKTLAGNLEQAAAHLVEMANEQGGRDNISVILARNRTEGGRTWRARIQDWVK